MSLNRSVTIVVFVALAGCGGLRRLPITSGDGGPTGSAGSSAGAPGRGGSGGTVGNGGSGGTGGSVAGAGGGSTGGSFVDAGLPDAPVCVAGGACVPANPCHKGMFVCGEGGMTCMELTDLQANGTVCGADMVCRNGTCGACMAGMACDVTGRPCRVGTIDCASGTPVCTETDNKPNGTMCGTGMVCQAGNCATCQMGGACTPTNRCHTGTLVCSGSAPACTDTGTNVPAGTSCGTDMVCGANGTCAACVAGTMCTVPGKPCSRGTIACNTGTPVCIETGNAPNGTACGTDMVCQDGNCAACSAGTICVPANPCHAGIMVCTPMIGCVDSGNSLANGAGCGTDRVCNAGTCVSCAAGASCQPTNPCRTGATSCATGSPVCVESGNRANGTSCGSNMVCSAGSCVTCTGGGSCTPSNPCHTGTLTCTTGAATCTDSGQNQPNGTACGTNLVCSAGNCVSCTAGQPCQPTNPCRNGATSCSTGAMVCMETTNKGVGTLCGAGQSCSGGVLTQPAMCNANGACVAATIQCPSGCNTSGTDCATCPAGQTSCPAGCRDTTRDVTNCGMCGHVCPSPADGTGIPVCVNGTCNVQCNPGFLECLPASLGMCQQTVWDFETMTLEGFKILATPTAISDKPQIVPKPVHNGRYALGLPIQATGTGMSRGFQVGPAICGAGRVIGKGLAVTAWILVDPVGEPPAIGRQSYFGVRVYSENNPDGVINRYPIRGYGEWFQVGTPVPVGDVELVRFAVEGVFLNDLGLGQDWVGAVYIDDVQIQ